MPQAIGDPDELDRFALFLQITRENQGTWLDQYINGENL